MNGLRVRAVVPERGLDVDLAVPAGRTLGLIGPNGAGKSTLLDVASGLLIPACGLVERDGTVLTERPGSGHVPPHRRGVVHLRQDAALFPRMSVLDNVAFGLRAAGRTRTEARTRAAELLAEFDAAGLAPRRPAELSGGQRARVALARALAPDPDVLVLDEPFAAVDAASAPGVREAARHALAGRTAVLVTHHAADLRALCADVAVLEGGRITAQGPVGQVLDEAGSAFLRGFSA